MLTLIRNVMAYLKSELYKKGKKKSAIYNRGFSNYFFQILMDQPFFNYSFRSN
jgi:hypothetical protein